MIGVRRLLVVLVLITVATVAGLRFSDHEGALLEADELAQAALLTEANMPPLRWAMVRADDREGDGRQMLPEPWGSGELARQVRYFLVEGSIEAGSQRGVMLTVRVYGSAGEANRVIERQRTRSETSAESDQRVLDALATAYEADTVDIQSEEPLYDLPETRGTRVRMSLTTADGTTESVWEEHTFARGRMVASYSAFGEDRRSLDHQGLLEAFEARVVAAQE